VAKSSSPDSAEKQFIEHLRHIAEFRFREERDQVRRRAAAARQRRRLLAGATKKLGIPLEHFDALHAADWKLIQRQAKAQEESAFALIKRHHARQRATLRTVLKNRERFEYKKGNPVFQTCLWRAAAAATAIVIPFTINEGVAGFAPPAGGFPIDLPVGETREIVDKRIHAGCDGGTRVVPVGPSGGESFQLVHPDVIAVAAGDTIRVAARFALRLSTALRGSAFANFSTGPAGFNVPMVLVKIAS
jgi:hypothetical protein